MSDVSINLTAGEIAKLDLKPGDELVVHCEHQMTVELVTEVREAVEQLFPGHRCTVIHSGLRLGVLSKPETAVKFREFL